MPSGQEYVIRIREQARKALAPQVGTVKEELRSLQGALSGAIQKVEEKLEAVQQIDVPMTEVIVADAVEEVTRQRDLERVSLAHFAHDVRLKETQQEILALLLEEANRFAPRVALFVIRDERIVGWSSRSYSADAAARIAGVSIGLSESPFLQRALLSEGLTSCADLSREADLAQVFRGEASGPWHAFPLKAIQRPVAVLLVAAAENCRCDLESLCLIMDITGLCIENLALKILHEMDVAVQRKVEKQPETVEAPAPVAPVVTPVEAKPEEVPVAEAATPESLQSTLVEIKPEEVPATETPAPEVPEVTLAETKPEEVLAAEAPALEVPEATLAEILLEEAPVAETPAPEVLEATLAEAKPEEALVAEMPAGEPAEAQPRPQEEPLQTMFVGEPQYSAPVELIPAAAPQAEEPPPASFIEAAAATPISSVDAPLPVTAEPEQVIEPVSVAEPEIVPEAPAAAEPAPEIRMAAAAALTTPESAPQVDMPAENWMADLERPEPPKMLHPVTPFSRSATREAQRMSDEEKLHADAKRFARLLVSEIKLYNEQRVLEGRENRDIYVRLKKDIDRSRDAYQKRTSPSVARKIDYFHDEVVRILGDNNPSTLGSDYPGPLVES